MSDFLPHTLVLQSNPSDTSRIRLDREARALRQVLTANSLPAEAINILQAVTVRDFADAVRLGAFDLIQFSGHGSEEGLLLESEDGEQSRLVTSVQLTAALRSSGPALRVLLCLACFTTSSLGELRTAAPWVVTFSGPVDDEACIEFVRAFYDAYIKSEGSVEVAFRSAADHLAYFGLQAVAQPVLTRRAIDSYGSDLLWPATIEGRDTILIDTSRVEDKIETLMNREAFFSLLGKKIRVHNWIFRLPREGALVPIGSVFGMFSWQSADQAVFLNDLRCLRKDVSQDVCTAWIRLLVLYNDLCAERYRGIKEPAAPQNAAIIEMAVTVFYHAYNDVINHPMSMPLETVGAQALKMCRALFYASIMSAEQMFMRDERGRTVAALEACLTALHDLVDTLADIVTEGVPARRH